MSYGTHCSNIMESAQNEQKILQGAPHSNTTYLIVQIFPVQIAAQTNVEHPVVLKKGDHEIAQPVPPDM